MKYLPEEVGSFIEIYYFTIHMKVWYEVWKHLSGETLVTCMSVCSWWRREIQRMIILNSSCQHHYFICKRLKYTPGNDALDHRKSGDSISSFFWIILIILIQVRNSLRFAVNQSVKFHGIWSYTGNDKEILGIYLYIIFKKFFLGHKIL